MTLLDSTLHHHHDPTAVANHNPAIVVSKERSFEATTYRDNGSSDSIKESKMK